MFIAQRCLVQVSFRPRLSDQHIREEALRLLQRARSARVEELERNGGAEQKVRPNTHTHTHTQAKTHTHTLRSQPSAVRGQLNVFFS